MQVHTITISEEDAGSRLDVVFARYLKERAIGLSRTALKSLIQESGLTVNGAVCTTAHYKLKERDVVVLSFEEEKPRTVSPEEIALDVVYEDADVAVINKPPGLVVHPAPGNNEHTLVNALLHRFGKLSDINPDRPGIVHRLDKDTSGLLVVAKTNDAHLRLSEQFAAHSIKRTYCAIVKGRVEFDEGVIEVPIGRHPVRRKEMAVSFNDHSKFARTHYMTLKRAGIWSFLELHPFTGRTHQLRVHLAYIGHPILGDVKYGKHTEFPRLALHAKTLGFIHPRTDKFIEFSSALPKEFDEFLAKGAQVTGY